MIATLLLAPLLAPAWGFIALIERLRDEAEATLRDEGRGYAELIDLSMRHASGELSDSDFAEQETAVLERLTAIRDYREDLLSAAADADAEDDYEAELAFDDVDAESESTEEVAVC